MQDDNSIPVGTTWREGANIVRIMGVSRIGTSVVYDLEVTTPDERVRRGVRFNIDPKEIQSHGSCVEKE